MDTNIKSMWARIILSTYKNIERVVNSLDRTINCIAMQGANGRNSYISTEKIVNKIIDIIYRKEGLINLKVIADDVLKCMKKEYVQLLKLKFIKHKKFQEIADIQGISLRTVFRHYDKALNQFNNILKLKGFTDEKLNEEYKDEPYLDKIKAKIIEEYRYLDNNKEKQNKKLKRVLENINIIYDKKEVNSY